MSSHGEESQSRAKATLITDHSMAIPTNITTNITYLPLGQPLGPTDPPTTRPLRAIVFDMDGTLNLPSYAMFPRMRAALGITPEIDILAHINSLPPHSEAYNRASAAIAAIEREEIASMQLQPGALTLLDFCTRKGVPKAILTRNNPEPVAHLLANLLSAHAFDPVITREFSPPKPEPAALIHIAQMWGIPTREVAMVGDGWGDMVCGRKAGAVTIMVENEGQESKVRECEQLALVDLTVKKVGEIVELLEKGFVVTRAAEEEEGG